MPSSPQVFHIKPTFQSIMILLFGGLGFLYSIQMTLGLTILFGLLPISFKFIGEPLPVILSQLVLLGLIGLVIYVGVAGIFISRSRSYLLVSSAGLEFKFDLNSYHIKFQWNEIEKIGVKQSYFKYDALFLKKAAPVGYNTYLFDRISKDGQHIIPLEVFEGWPNGALADEFKHYAPYLFPIGQ